jgi:hypothetical protein
MASETVAMGVPDFAEVELVLARLVWFRLPPYRVIQCRVARLHFSIRASRMSSGSPLP